jgi:exopolysaccharide biosynthesis polyprenyl glycosylphosphotransferase
MFDVPTRGTSQLVETLQDYNTAVVPIGRDTETSGYSVGHLPRDIELEDGDAFMSVALAPLPERRAQESLPVEDRFARDFADPQLPNRHVPYARAKRAFDVLFAGLLLAVAWPIMLIVAFAVKLTSRGPVIFRQVRVGRQGRHFYCCKFRSMVADAESKKTQIMHLNEATGPVFKIKNDPRLTPIGALIRKTSLDELPQLFNVLRGDMSIVGPRPPIPSEVAEYSSHARGRLAVQPGLTCLWQVSGRSNVSFERWIELDLHYIDTMSFTNDLKIVLRTIPAVLLGAGAQ